MSAVKYERSYAACAPCLRQWAIQGAPGGEKNKNTLDYASDAVWPQGVLHLCCAALHGEREDHCWHRDQGLRRLQRGRVGTATLTLLVAFEGDVPLARERGAPRGAHEHRTITQNRLLPPWLFASLSKKYSKNSPPKIVGRCSPCRRPFLVKQSLVPNFSNQL